MDFVKQMTVGALIEELKKFPADLGVCALVDPDDSAVLFSSRRVAEVGNNGLGVLQDVVGVRGGWNDDIDLEEEDPGEPHFLVLHARGDRPISREGGL